jgi:hypothetical protein
MGAKQFVVHAHKKIDVPVHYDLMLERGESLQTFRLELPPDRIKKRSCEAIKINDHPRRFLFYEGSVHGGRGRIKMVDCGTYQLVGDDENRLELEFWGQLLNGRFVLKHIDGDTWQFEDLTNGALDSRNHRRH